MLFHNRVAAVLAVGTAILATSHAVFPTTPVAPPAAMPATLPRPAPTLPPIRQESRTSPCRPWFIRAGGKGFDG